jgi:bifunctional ADP-heptose synthase (sugar kinase/adenylyltransferase)
VTARPRLTVIGDALLDRDIEGRAERLAPDAPVPVVDEPVERTRPGGAALAAALAARAGADVTLVCALGDDHAGRVVAELLQRRGVALCDLGSTGPTPEKVRVHASGRPVVRLDHGGAPGRPGVLGQAARDALARADAVLISDYGRGVAAAADRARRRSFPGRRSRRLGFRTLGTPSRTRRDPRDPPTGMKRGARARHSRRSKTRLGR